VPTGLLESELFGHEKGAFTGAIAQQTGRFELAHRGTLLLDEIGDIPLELQPKLLRALQEQQFERLGNPHTITVNVRVIASTNRDLPELVTRHDFREDLYYRLNVFPIIVPPLRERRSDIPILARYFAHKYGEKIRRRIDLIPPEVMDQLTKSNWPGNIRELENVIERAVIVSRDGILRISAPEVPHTSLENVVTLETVERETILKALRACRGVIGGKDGAAAKLGMKRTTLNSRMQKLGIGRQDL
jgi:formate hydrogenlyase transcriptional activator